VRSTSPRRFLLAFVVATLVFSISAAALAPTALAQEPTPETFPEPEAEPTVERDVNETDDEFRLAVIGLIGIAVVTFVLILLYWSHTGRAARRRFEVEHPELYDDGYDPYQDPNDVGFYEQPPGSR
jgi:hypothetical protein